MKINKTLIGTALCALLVTSFTHAAGIAADSSIIVINEAEGGSSINIHNGDKTPITLHSKIVDLKDDASPQVVITQPVIHIKSNQTQSVHFTLNSSAPLKHEHLKQVTFEAIPAVKDEKNHLGAVSRQELPLLIVPKDLAAKPDSWNDLIWSAKNNTLTVTNNGPYVVRLNTKITLMPDSMPGTLEKPYILPGETLVVYGVCKHHLPTQTSVVIAPLSRAGNSVGDQTMALSR
ncbi:hypothetical protein BTJ39_10180 [Izhakiella australiensis]|uniref:Pili assembly chaperone N-terminal domain-containing protein n=1 Tax=Izhakiella australiensis TaxID=1926881 RepID=A0A1S8YN07_9GAMM|nr:fimbria/pilus chaperone family protein [Izhakiella australiensis]OON40302.1 hypothetical protein BTJ39_10180 [Izhakiella australiensis]